MFSCNITGQIVLVTFLVKGILIVILLLMRNKNVRVCIIATMEYEIDL